MARSARRPAALGTGGRRGRGRGTAFALAEAGFDLALADLELDDAARETASGAAARGVRDMLVPDGAVAHTLARINADRPELRRVAIYDNGWHMLLRDLDGARVQRDILRQAQDEGSTSSP